MKDLILETVHDICDKEDLNLDTMPFNDIMKLHERAESELKNRLIDEADNLRKAKKEQSDKLFNQIVDITKQHAENLKGEK